MTGGLSTVCVTLTLIACCAWASPASAQADREESQGERSSDPREIPRALGIDLSPITGAAAEMGGTQNHEQNAGEPGPCVGNDCDSGSSAPKHGNPCSGKKPPSASQHPDPAGQHPKHSEPSNHQPNIPALINQLDRNNASNLEDPVPFYGYPVGGGQSDDQGDIPGQINRMGNLLQQQQQDPATASPPLRTRTRPLPSDGPEFPATVTDDPELWTEDPTVVDGGPTFEIGNPPDSAPTLDIHPIQVVQGGYGEKLEMTPLIEDKLTMVRVFVHIPKGSMKIRGAKCVLNWNGTEYSVTGDLETDPGGRTLVRRQSNRSDLTPGINGSQDANWAFNFIFKGGDGAFGLKMPGKLVLKATLFDPSGRKIDEATESSGSHFTIQKAKPFKVRLVLRSQGGHFHTEMGKRGRKKAQAALEKDIRRSILARYPIPASKLQISWGKGKVSRIKRKEGEDEAQYLDRIRAETAASEGKAGAFDAIFVVAERMDLGDGKKTITPSGFTPNDPATKKPGRTHFLFAGGNKYYSEPTPPHEIGHQARFFGAAHRARKVDDAWDAGGYWNSMAITTFSMEGFSNLMKENELAQWVDVKEYRSLCLKLKAGS